MTSKRFKRYWTQEKVLDFKVTTPQYSKIRKTLKLIFKNHKLKKSPRKVVGEFRIEDIFYLFRQVKIQEL
jgi:hypothetical protein